MYNEITNSEIIFRYVKDKKLITYHIYKLKKREDENIVWWKQKNTVIGGSLDIWLDKFINLSSITLENNIREKIIIYKYNKTKKFYIIKNPTNENILKLYNIYK